MIFEAIKTDCLEQQKPAKFQRSANFCPLESKQSIKLKEGCLGTRSQQVLVYIEWGKNECECHLLNDKRWAGKMFVLPHTSLNSYHMHNWGLKLGFSLGVWYATVGVKYLNSFNLSGGTNERKFLIPLMLTANGFTKRPRTARILWVSLITILNDDKD